MRTKVKLTKTFGMTKERNNRGTLILIELWKKQSNDTRNMKNVNFVPKEISQYSQGNTCVRVSILIKMQAFRPATLLKRRLQHRLFFFWQYCQIFKNSYFEEHLWTAASTSFSFYVSLNVFLNEQIT